MAYARRKRWTTTRHESCSGPNELGCNSSWTRRSRQDRTTERRPTRTGDITDPAEPLITEQTDDAVAASLSERLEAIRRAEARLVEGTFGRSVRSGLPIPDDRLRADPAAELTIEEARRGP
jgi:DnaK suppressor protein